VQPESNEFYISRCLIVDSSRPDERFTSLLHAPGGGEQFYLFRLQLAQGRNSSGAFANALSSTSMSGLRSARERELGISREDIILVTDSI